jgi:hypothetical protein
MRVYLCGPDDGFADEIDRFAAFLAAEIVLTDAGHQVSSAYTTGLADDLLDGAALDAVALDEAEVVVTLPGTPADAYELSEAQRATKLVLAIDDLVWVHAA